jgi:hypothetical protein
MTASFWQTSPKFRQASNGVDATRARARGETESGGGLTSGPLSAPKRRTAKGTYGSGQKAGRSPMRFMRIDGKSQ